MKEKKRVRPVQRSGFRMHSSTVAGAQRPAQCAKGGAFAGAHMLCAVVLQGIIINMGSVAAVEPMTQACACESLRPPSLAGRQSSELQRLALTAMQCCGVSCKKCHDLCMCNAQMLQRSTGAAWQICFGCSYINYKACLLTQSESDLLSPCRLRGFSLR